MKWIYGKQDFRSLERAQENCYLMTNGLGGYSSMTMAGSVTRNDHAFFMACVKAPNHRYNMVHRIRERLETGRDAAGAPEPAGDLGSAGGLGSAGAPADTGAGCDSPEEGRVWPTLPAGRTYVLSSQEFADGTREKGYEYLSSFVYEDSPVWTFKAGGVEIRKEAGMKQGANTAALRYEIRNRGREACRLTVTPFLQFAPKGKEPDPGQEFHREGNRIESGGLSLYFRTNGETRPVPALWERYHYRYDACDGRRESGLARADHEIFVTVDPGESGYLEIIYEMEPGEDSARQIIRDMQEFRKRLADQSGFCTELARDLAKSAAQFVSRRESTGGDTILAGFPFFEDWGRDTMIALPGICIATGRYETAKRILRTFAAYERGGLMPNLFPEGGREPLYNTADAALLFINCVYFYYEATEDAELVRELYPVMERIIEGYQKGTEFSIHMDEDGLILAGDGLDQVTWMDVRAGDILPTPRHGKPVEINAYWYNALCIMDVLGGAVGPDSLVSPDAPAESGVPAGSRGRRYESLAERVKTSFRAQFWMEEEGYLRDVLSGTRGDAQFRCNQIWAVSLPFTMLEAGQEYRVVEAVFERLYTPCGLRTLEEEDEEFHPFYGGPMLERDMAYHQGTVWVFPLGGYYLAYLKVRGYSKEAKRTVAAQLEALESALREGCISQLPEIYDGKNPAASKGCFAQAWSIGEILRVFKEIEK